jgi:hypothetical protein
MSLRTLPGLIGVGVVVFARVVVDDALGCVPVGSAENVIVGDNAVIEGATVDVS